MSKSKPTKAEREQQMRLVRRALREKLGIDPSAFQAKRRKKKEDTLTDPDEELHAGKKVERKGYAASVSSA